MSDLKVDGFKASELIASISDSFATLSEPEKAAQMKKVNGIFQLQVSNEAKEVATWTIDLKNTGTVYKGEAKPKKADVTIILSDDTLVDLASGKLNGQKAFMTGKLKTKGNMMLATKLDGVLKLQPKAKL